MKTKLFFARFCTLVALVAAACRPTSKPDSGSDGSRETIRQLQTEVERLKEQLAKQQGEHLPVSTSNIGERDPPQSVLDAAVKREFERTSGDGSEQTRCSYSVTNHYTRHIKDEIFHIYEFRVKCTTDSEYIERTYGHSFQAEREAGIGFVERGNEWQWRQWNANE